MTGQQRRATADLVLAGFVTAGSLLLFIGAAELPPPRWEPLGSAALPRILGALLIFFAALIAARAVLEFRTPPPADDLIPQANTGRGFAVLAALILYVFAMDVLRVPFVPATTVFVAVVGLSIGARTLMNVGVFLALGLALSLGISTILERFLHISIG